MLLTRAALQGRELRHELGLRGCADMNLVEEVIALDVVRWYPSGTSS